MLKKLYLIIGLFICSISFLHAQNYNQVVYLPSSLTKEVAESVDDMNYWLQQATGKSFSIKTNGASSNNGIQLQGVEQSNLPASIKKQILQDGQSFYLEIDNYKTARIVGSGENSFINGIYTFLHELGFRWYMPGDAWTIIPRLNKTSLKVAKVYKPAFQNRSYFGTGGIAPIQSIDPKNTFRKDFDLWDRRNRISSDYAIKGHTGQAFYKANQAELDKHPEYFCKGKVDKYGRIAINNSNAVNLYTEWALGQIKPNDPFPVIGVDPADGSGGADDCLPTNMPQVKTWSDKYFWLANKVAQQSEKKGMNALVQLYAYSEHAAPPQFELHKNIYPVIIPYAFQNVAEPEQFIELWYQKIGKRPMGLYDYWNITQWSSDVPQFNIYAIPEKLRLWKKYNINTINLEATNAKGPMGHAFWLATQMMWDTNLSFDELYNEFLTQCFGPAAPDLRRMYDRWSKNYQGAMDVALSLHDLADASAKTKDPAIQKRISELKAYIHYLQLYYDYLYKPSAQGYATLIDYIYSIHYLRLLQTYALQSRYIRPPAGTNKTLNKAPVAMQDSGAGSSDGSKASKSLDYSDIEKNFEKDLQANPVSYAISKFEFDLKKTSSIGNEEMAKYNPKFIIGKNRYQFYLANTQKLRIKAGSTGETRLIIKDEQYNVKLDKVISASKEGYENIEVELPKGMYTLTYGAYYRKSRIMFPGNIPFFSANHFYDNAGYPLLYVYVPKDVSEIIYTDGEGPGVNKRGDWINPEGKHVKPELIKYSTYRIPVPAQFRGKVWILNIGHRTFQMLNIPNIYSLNNFEYKE